jgi:hypothetical protein
LGWLTIGGEGAGLGFGSGGFLGRFGQQFRFILEQLERFGDEDQFLAGGAFGPFAGQGVWGVQFFATGAGDWNGHGWTGSKLKEYPANG